ncbi:MAG: maleylpyruvate isomerase N-terminal domain-containing protein [Nitrolancea sp.]
MAVNTQERLDILQDVSKSWLELVKAVRGLSDEQVTKPASVDQWSVKDIMAHVTFWESRLIHDIGLLERGETPPEESDFESINQEESTRSRAASLDDVRAQFDAMHDQMMGMLEGTSHLSRELVAGNTYEHYDEHLADIRKAFK